MRITTVVVMFGLALAACGGMMTGQDAMRSSVDDAVTEDQTHLATARAITAMPALLAEVDRHASRMGAIMDDMGNDMASMGHCSDMQAMMDLRDGMRGELAGHAIAMHASPTFDDARAEIERHVGTMGSMLSDMDTTLGGMRCGGW